ncbi:MAG TPA: DUF2905 domain-containing protein [Ktedonobacteraceae bacterium]|nr:DUF2905 domain-containing protein [Ktedonobacteraceae bacterium]
MTPLDLSSIGKIFVLGGIIIAIFGVLLLVISNTVHIPFLGRLPGDIVIRQGSSIIFFPIVTCIILSIVLTIVVNLVSWLLRH